MFICLEYFWQNYNNFKKVNAMLRKNFRFIDFE
jgi:hypothetical protein